MATVLPPPPIGEPAGSFAWQQWYLALSQIYSGTGTIPWALVDTAGSNLTDIATRAHNNLQTIQGGASNDYYHLVQTSYNEVVNHNFTETLTIPKTKGKGVKIDNTTPTFGWRDIIGEPVVKTTGAAAPSMVAYRGNIVNAQFSNAVTQELFNNYHIPHDYVPGSDLFIHIHWSQNVVDTGGTAGAPGVAKWSFEVSYAKGHDQAAFIAPITTSVTQTASDTQYQHMLAEVQLSATTPSGTQLDSDNIEADGILLIRTFRDPADAADTLDQAPFAHFIDIHYQSTNVGTKQKAPDFWT